MNLVEKLIKADAGKAEELSCETFKSKRLAKLIGESEPIDITVQEIGIKRINDIIAMAYDKKGNFDQRLSFDANAMLLADGVIDPDLKDKKLQEHYNCNTPKELAIKLFSAEVGTIADKIIKLSGVTGAEEAEEEIKN